MIAKFWHWPMGKLDMIRQLSHWDTTSRNLYCFLFYVLSLAVSQPKNSVYSCIFTSWIGLKIQWWNDQSFAIGLYIQFASRIFWHLFSKILFHFRMAFSTHLEYFCPFWQFTSTKEKPQQPSFYLSWRLWHRWINWRMKQETLKYSWSMDILLYTSMNELNLRKK